MKTLTDSCHCVLKPIRIDAVGQRVRTTFGEGTILSVIEATAVAGFRYRIKLPWGLGYIRPESIVHIVRGARAGYVRNGSRMERCPQNEEEAKLRIPPNFTLLFGSQSAYCFIRLYGYLTNVLSAIEEHFAFCKDNMDVDEGPSNPSAAKLGSIKASTTPRKQPTTQHTFSSYLKKAQGVLSNNGGKDLDFERYCRECIGLENSLRGPQNLVALFAVVPSLAEKCGNALARVAREDALLTLYDYSKLHEESDPVWLREQSKTVVEKPCFRIQYDENTSTFYFAYVEPSLDLLAPPEDDENDEAEAEGDDDGDAQTMDVENDDQAVATEKDTGGGAAQETTPTNGASVVALQEGQVKADEEPEAKRMKLG